ncbi:cupin domain-containing protein [soil metagenome]
MLISKNGTRAITKGSAEYFTGDVHVEPFVSTTEPAHVQTSSVCFQPGAHSAWHTHPLGQILIVTAGCGVIQCFGEPAQFIGPGDIIWTPPSVKHWHGAVAYSGMTHISIVENLDGKGVDWLEHVTDSEYASGCAQCEIATSISSNQENK